MTITNFLPPEWHPQDAVLITWPHQESAWQTMLAEVEQTYFDLTTTLSHYQPLVIQAHSSIDLSLLIAELSAREANLSNCHFVRANGNDTWTRDHGPICVITESGTQALNFVFDGWGGKFDATLDNTLNTQLFDKGVLVNLQDINWTLEGGSIESDGQGSLMTTSNCVLNENRNGKVNRENLENLFKTNFGVSHIIWLEHGELAGDDTDAHIDTLARFAPNNQIIFQGCHDSSDEHFASLHAMKLEIENVKNAYGQPYKLTELPFPKAIYAEDGHRLPATYANFLITNKLVLVPTYNDEADIKAIELIETAFPDHIVVGINACPLIEEHGSLHCITMQLPKGAVDFDAKFVRIHITG